MDISINGKNTEIPEGLSVKALLDQQRVRMPDMVTVELNGEILERKTFDAIVLKEEDRVEFLYFMGGGGIEV